MKNFFRKPKPNNRGMSLVEVICAVAILAVIGTAVAGIMMTSSQTYTRGTTEANVQQEAQLLANRISDMAIDADSYNIDSVTGDLLFSKGGVSYRIEFRSSVGEVWVCINGEADLLAENVESFVPEIENGVIVLNIKVTKEAGSYICKYTIKNRNSSVSSNTVYDTSATVIIDETELVAEPGQVIDLSTLHAHASDGSAISFAIASPVSDSATTVYTDPMSAGVYKLSIGKNETNAEIYLSIKTASKKEDGITPLASATVTVHVRRAQSISVTGTLVFGSACSNGAVYRVTASTTGLNLPKYATLSSDNNYISPYNVRWDCSYTVGGSVVGGSYYEVTKNVNTATSTDAPYLEFKLKRDMPEGSKIIVRATALHPNGMEGSVKTNKSGIAYLSTPISDEYKLFIPSITLPVKEIVVEPGQTFDINSIGATVDDPMATLAWSVSGATNSSISGTNLNVGIYENAADYSLKVNVAGMPGAGTKTVTVHVRRVKEMVLKGKLTWGNAGKRGAEYTLTAKITGTNLDRFYGLPSDNDYVNPYDIDWSHVYNSNGDPGNANSVYQVSLISNGNASTPATYKVTLKKDMPAIGSTIAVTAKSKHAAGANKSHVSYGNLSDTYRIVRSLFDITGDFYRGTPNQQGHVFEAELKNAVRESLGYYVDFNEFNGRATVYKEYRYRPANSSSWSPWIVIGEGGDAVRINESCTMFRCDTEYVIEIRCGCVYNGTVIYPTKYVAEAYTFTTDVQKAKLKLNISRGWNNYLCKDAVSGGTASAPMQVNRGEHLDINVIKGSEPEMGIRWERYSKSLSLTFQRFNGMYWENVGIGYSSNTWGVPVTTSSDGAGNFCNMDNGRTIWFNEPGKYRMLVGIGNMSGGNTVMLKGYNEWTRSFYDAGPDNSNLWDETTGEEIFYFEVR